MITTKRKVKTKIFRQESNLLADLDTASRRAQYEGLAASGLGQAQQHLDRSALARAVGPKKSENFPATHRQGEVAHRDLAAVNLAQILRSDRELIG